MKWFLGCTFAVVLALTGTSAAQDVKIVKTDTMIDGLDPGIRLFVREKMQDGNTRFADDNIILFLHGATAPSTCDFDLSYNDYSWADWLVKRGYVVFMGDYRNYGYSSRETAMDEPPAQNQPVTRSYLALRDIEAMVNYIKKKHGVKQVTLIGWSWGAMMAGYYASLHTENVHKLVMYAPLYHYAKHTNLGAGSALQNKRKPGEFNFALGAYRYASEAANTKRWNGEIPVADKSQYRDPQVPVEFWKECMATDPTSNTRKPPSLRAPNGVLEDSFYQAIGERMWHASNIYSPTLVIAGQFDTWSFPEDREGLMHDLVHAPVKQSVLIPDATHFVLFEKNRMMFFNEVLKFLKR
ncbi:MAG TPA: alpha/beta hydrolase [Pirellulales bacterium]|jgi:pimeloyl-ACP methyl ester carboxylesterase|nr:alpha/beta hydrolase [Pirellulales bacterium]